MPFTYRVYCTVRGCPHQARYKIAARWSDGLTEELKTYGLACEACLPHVYRLSLDKQRQCRTAQGETLEPPGIFQLEPGRRDGQLQRLPELEEQLRG
jgi:hypothetical protein